VGYIIGAEGCGCDPSPWPIRIYGKGGVISNKYPEGRHEAIARLGNAAVILAACLYRWAPGPPEITLSNSGYESIQLAFSLAGNRGFANPFGDLQSGPTAHLSPVFPFFLSLVIRWFGDGSSTAHIIDWLGVVAAGLQLSLWPFAARRLGMNFSAGVLAAGFWLWVGFEPRTVWEADYVALLVILVSMAMYKILTQGCSRGYISMVAVLWGFIIFSMPVALLPFVAFGIWMVMVSKVGKSQKLAFVLIPFIVLTPWTIRNYNTFHHIFLIRDNLGLELGASNNPCAKFSDIANEDSQCFIHPYEDDVEAQRIQQMGEHKYNQARLHEALSWIGSNPSRFLNLTVQRFVAFWFPNETGNPFTSQPETGGKVFWILTLFSLPGLLLLWRVDRTGAGICLVWLVLFPPVYYLLQFDVRYRVPIMWATMLPAAFIFTYFFRFIVARIRKVGVSPR
jgi:hypothetical protein